MTNATALSPTANTSSSFTGTAPLTSSRSVTRAAVPAIGFGPELFWHDFCEACSTPHNHGQRWCVNCDWDG